MNKRSHNLNFNNDRTASADLSVFRCGSFDPPSMDTRDKHSLHVAVHVLILTLFTTKYLIRIKNNLKHSILL